MTHMEVANLCLKRDLSLLLSVSSSSTSLAQNKFSFIECWKLFWVHVTIWLGNIWLSLVVLLGVSLFLSWLRSFGHFTTLQHILITPANRRTNKSTNHRFGKREEGNRLCDICFLWCFVAHEKLNCTQDLILNNLTKRGIVHLVNNFAYNLALLQTWSFLILYNI